MNMTSIFKLGNDSGMFDERRRAINNYKLMQWARWATFGLYIVAVFMLYVADVWGIATFMQKNSSEYVALVVFSLISFTLAYFLASGKEAVYEDIAICRSEGFKLTGGQIFAMALFASSGILFELFSATSNQQHITNNAAEQAGLLKPAEPGNITVGTSPELAKRVEDAQAKLNDCQANLGKKFKDCKYSEGRLAAAKANMTASNQTAAAVSSEIYGKQLEHNEALLERFDKPMFVVVGKAVNGDTADGMIIAVSVMITIFELQHILSLFAYGNALRRMTAAAGKKSASTPPENSGLPDTDQPVAGVSPSAIGSAFASAADTARQTVGNELIKAQAGREQANRAMGDALGQVGDKLDNLTRPDQVQPDLTEPDLTEPDPVQPDRSQADLTEAKREPDPIQPDLTEAKREPDPAQPDLADRTRNSGHKRPALTAAAAVRIISAQVRSQIDAGKVRPEPRHVNIAVQVCYDQIDSMWSAPDLDLDQITADILDNLTAGRAEPDLTALPPQPDLNNLTGQVGQVRSNEVRSGGADLTEIEQKLAIAEQEKVRLQEQMEADRKAAEAEKVRLQEAARKLAEAKAAEAAAKARAEAEAKARAERAAAERAKAEQAQREEAARQAGAAKAKAEAEAKERAEAEAAERGKLTEDQVSLAANVIADAIRSGQVTTLGFSSLAPILKAAGLPKSSDSIRTLIKLGCRKLLGNLTAPNPKPGNGKPEFVIA